MKKLSIQGQREKDKDAKQMMLSGVAFLFSFWIGYIFLSSFPKINEEIGTYYIISCLGILAIWIPLRVKTIHKYWNSEDRLK